MSKKSKWYLSAVIVCSFLAPGACWATDYYVDAAGGNNANSGKSPTEPMASHVRSKGISQRDQVVGLLRSAVALSSLAWAMFIVLIGLTTSMATTERRREIGVLRALGATRTTVLQSLLAEGALLALAGGAAGITLAAFAIFLFKDLITRLMGTPFLLPTPLSLLVLTVGGLALALVSVTLATLFPTWRISHEEPATAMKEW